LLPSVHCYFMRRVLGYSDIYCFYITSASTHCSVCDSHMSLKDLLTHFLRIRTYKQVKVIQGHRSWCQSKAHTVYDFLLVISSNFGRIFLLMACFSTRPLFDAPARGNDTSAQKPEGRATVW